jgi:nucleotide-binding universal stress UspA family protein
MKLDKKAILVPWDYTQKCEYAFLHAINFSKILDNEIVLLHIVANGGKKASEQSKLDAVAEDLEKKHGVKPKTYIKDGKLTTVFHQIPKEINASLCIMKTDGYKGMQKYFGSRAIKMIFGTEVPFLVIQDKPSRENYGNIVFPIDYSFESKEKLHWIKWLARYFKCTVQIVTPDISDGALRTKIKQNVIFAKNIFHDENIPFEIIVGAGKGEFAAAIMNFANKVDADLIIAMAPKDIGFKDFMNGSRCQRLLVNKHKVPIFCINPRKLRKFGGFR